LWCQLDNITDLELLSSRHSTFSIPCKVDPL
jgi:hypothetical protein